MGFFEGWNPGILSKREARCWIAIVNGKRESVILRSRIREIITSNEPRTRMSVDGNEWRNWTSQSMKSTRHTGSLAFKGRSGWSAKLFNYCAGTKILWEARLPVYQKILSGSQSNLVSKTAASNGLETLQQVSELYRYDTRYYWVVWH